MESREKSKHVQKKSQPPTSKRRRLNPKQEWENTQGAQEAPEGISYKSGTGHKEEVVKTLPESIQRGAFKPVPFPTGDPTFIIFDLETTGLIRGNQIPHIIQIAAAEFRNGDNFNAYVIPKCPITTNAEEVTGIVMSKPTQMVVRGLPVKSRGIKRALRKFFKWLEQYSNVILVAHNGRLFDFPVLFSALRNTGKVDRFLSCVNG